MVFIFKRYYSYPVNTEIEFLQKVLDFPTVTICNLNTIEYDKVRDSTEPTAQDLFNFIETAQHAFTEHVSGVNIFVLFFKRIVHFNLMVGSPTQGGGLVLHQMSGSRVHHVKKHWTQLDLRFCENDQGSKRSKINEKGVNRIENQGEHLYKML